RHYEGDATFFKEATDNLGGAMLQHFHNLAFPAPAIIHLIHPGGYPVTVEYLAHLPGGQKQVGATIIGDQKPETISMANHAPGDQIRFLYRQERIPAVTDQLSITAHRNQTTAQRFNPFRRRLPEFPTQGLVRGWRTSVFQVLENVFPTLDGVVIFLGLTLGMRVTLFVLPGNHSDPFCLTANSAASFVFDAV